MELKMVGKFDKSIFIAKFKEETDERLNNLNKGLLNLEENPENEALLNEVFREAHTLKGSAKMVGLSHINRIAHQMEDLLGRVKEKQLNLTPQINDLLFECIDSIKILTDAEISKKEVNIDVDLLCEDLKKACTGELVREKRKVEKKIRLIEGAPQEVRYEKIGFEETIRVEIGKLDKLLNLSGEMIINRGRLNSLFAQLKDISELTGEQTRYLEQLKDRANGFKSDVEKLSLYQQKVKDGLTWLLTRYDEGLNELSSFTNELEDIVIKMRMLPVATIFDLFPRVIRDMAKEYDKEINLEIKGEKTGLDKKILEEIKDPLMHLVRNCVDHGIETPEERALLGKPRAGKICFEARQEGANILIEILDDGRGIDANKIKRIALKKKLITPEQVEKLSGENVIYLIFTPGFSTRENVTDISGRGVGLDVVKENIERLKGSIIVSTQPSKGTKFTLRMPLTLSITLALIVKSSKQIFAIPTSEIEKIVRVSSDEIKLVGDKEVVKVDDKTIPFVKLNRIFGLKEPITPGEMFMIIIYLAGERIGFIVDEIISEQEIVIKSLGEYVKKPDNISGATIWGDGEIVLIVDVFDLMKSAKKSYFERNLTIDEEKEEVSRYAILVVDDSLTTRELEKNILESVGYEVDLAIDGSHALEKLKQKRFNLVVTDIAMPNMNGFELTSCIKNDDKYKDIPVIMVTAEEKEEDKKRGVEVGASAYILKSAFDQKGLLDIIGRLVG
ncbi:MAG: hybrid sensor histidine kinase/response regulator [bacterium]|nr:hybrid sensor histidine kinase/response regulator [bacterium]